MENERAVAAWESGGDFPTGYKLDLPNFPMESLPPNLRQFSENVAENVQVDPAMVAVPLLATLCVPLQSRFVVRIDSGYTEPLCLYTLTIARPSERKSAVISLLEKPLWEYQSRANKTLKAMGQPLKTLYVTDATPEKLAKLMEENNGACALLSDEPDALAVAAGLRYGKSRNLGLMLQAWSAGHVMIQRATENKRTAIDRAVMSVAVMSQPSFVENLIKDKEMSNRGFMQRFLYAMPDSKVGLRSFYKPELSKILYDEYCRMMEDFLEMGAGLREIRLGEDARPDAALYFREVESLMEKEPKLEGWLGKLFGQTLRIAGVLHCAIWGTEAAEHELEGLTMRAAIKISEYFTSHAKAVFFDMDTPQEVLDARDVYRKMEGTGRSSVTKTEMYSICGLRGARLDAALAFLNKAGFIGYAEEKAEGRGRPKIAYIIRANLHKEDAPSEVLE